MQKPNYSLRTTAHCLRKASIFFAINSASAAFLSDAARSIVDNRWASANNFL